MKHDLEDSIIIRIYMAKVHDESIVTEARSYRFEKESEKLFSLDEKDYSYYEIEQGQKGFVKILKSEFLEQKQFIDRYILEVGLLEDALYDRKIPRYFIDQWFDLKKDLSKIERIFEKNILALKEISRETEEAGLLNKFLDDLSTLTMNIRNQVSKLDGIHHYYTSIRSDRLNHNIYILTLLSSIFLPLNLIVGLFGMNTQNLFFHDNPQGTQNVIYILVGVIVFSLSIFKIIRIVDQFILQTLLGKNNLYQKIKQKISS